MFLRTHKRFHSSIFYLTLPILLLFVYACGSGTDSSDSDDRAPSTGSIALYLVWEKHAAQSPELLAQSPGGDVCSDYGISAISGQVLDSSRNIVAAEVFSCSMHKGSFTNIPLGTMSVELVGVVGGDASWFGELSDIEVTANGNTDPVRVEMHYNGDNTVPPEVVDTDPKDLATDVSVNKTIVAQFSEGLVEASLNTDTFKLNDGTSDVPGSVTWDLFAQAATFTPANRLVSNTTYTATITDSIEDKQGITMAADFSWSFTTSPVALGVELIDDPVFGQSAVIRDEANDLDFLRLDFTTPFSYEQIVAQLNPGGEFEGWRIAALADLELLGSSADIVTGSADIEMLERTELLRDMFCFDCVHLSSTHEYARGLISETYVNDDGATFQRAFTMGRRFNVTPNEVDFRISGYGGQQVSGEEIFLVRADADTTPPQVDSINPSNGEDHVVVNKIITATFSEPMDPSTITHTTFLVNDGENEIEGQVNYAGRTASFTPAALAGGTQYTVTITSDVRDVAGNPMESIYTWSFTTSRNVSGLVFIDDTIFGPSSVIRDEANDLDFLRLDFTTPFSYEQIAAELNPGGEFEGWRIAALADLELLGSTADIENGSTDIEMLERTELLRDMFCFDCGHLSSTHEYARGLISETYVSDDGTTFQRAFSMGRRFNVTPNEVDFRVSGYGGQQASSEEIFLVRAVAAD